MLQADCPLCGAQSARDSWIGDVRFLGRSYTYVECTACRSAYVAKMPDPETISLMYGPEYLQSFAGEENSGGAALVAPVLQELGRHQAGRLLDYGCGEGHLLADALVLGWECFGAEYDPAVAQRVQHRLGCTVLAAEDVLKLEKTCDVVHLGDVIEHLPNASAEFERVLRLLKPGGLLIAQGPLENNPNLFHAVVRLSRSLGRRAPVDMPPYHVILATAAGQCRFFERHGLLTRTFRVAESTWPAPAELAQSPLRFRSVMLWFLRRLSQVVTAARNGDWGNRYFYVGVVS